MEEESKASLHALMMEIVSNQLNDNNPPQVKEALNRLLSEGFSEEKSMNLIGCAVSVEIFGTLKEGKPYDEARYIKALKRLPKLPWD
ncbi:hypothetical protein L2735_16185 [Shewanella olleyana]|uniref:hypothetical protein n=1 Tax=Shewanella olleyana TaxID=135626 RepID=UPI00201075A0|nr:hypothetical protein [Shewanella olleyana]MCL1068315.1 hypothetical protein [Shewanella olleyana]